MQLNLPIFEQLASCRNLLIVGMGGGFDIFCALPIYYELRQRGQNVHLANLTFSDLFENPVGIHLTSSLVGITADYPGIFVYFPERALAQWLREAQGEEVIIWCIQKTGMQPLVANYRALVDHLEIDGLLLIDGGIDSLVRGDEAALGTLLEDSLSLGAAAALDDVPIKLLACLGLGAEQDISYAAIFENIAALAEAGGFLGSCSLTKQMAAYQAYEQAVEYAHDQPFQDPSVINASVISAVRGRFGNYHLTEKTHGSRLWISPLMAIYWFFDLPAVARQHLLLHHLETTVTFRDAVRALGATLASRPKRPARSIEL